MRDHNIIMMAAPREGAIKKNTRKYFVVADIKQANQISPNLVDCENHYSVKITILRSSALHYSALQSAVLCISSILLVIGQGLFDTVLFQLSNCWRAN